MLQYDARPRKSLLDRFHDDEVSLEAIASGEASQHGDFVDGPYDARVRRNPDRIQVQLSRAGRAYGKPLRITKGLTTACCETCPTGARQLVDLKDPKDPVHEFMRTHMINVLKPQMATGSKVYYNALDGAVR